MNDNSSCYLRILFIFIASTSIISIGVQPILIGLLEQRVALSLSQQSGIMAGELAGSVLGALLSPLAARYLSRRNVYVAAAGCALLFSLLCAGAEHLIGLMVCRVMVGIGAGLLCTHAISDLGRLPGQDRSFGLTLLLQTTIFAFFASALPQIAVWVGISGAIASIGGWFMLMLLGAPTIPRHPAQPPEIVTQSQVIAGQGSVILGRLSMLGMVLLQLAIYSVWGFIDQIGRDRGISPVDIGWAFGLGILGGLPGAGIPSLLGANINRNLAIAVGLLAVLLSIVLLAKFVDTPAMLFAAIFVMNFGWVLALSYFMSSITVNDPNGKLTPLIGIAQVAAAAIAPTLMALLLQVAETQIIFIVAASAAIASFVINYSAGVYARRGRRRLSSLV
ncbi:MFS transporter [Scandinavium manionii]|uniref:MFS transporter n=1 Tax=Scandinavium manionii TaxID=2926520 RepID=UPI00135B7572|nr:MFS transporter [Scandinavium manionii]MCS2149969.1 MFS transporter [Scandinavium manionii]MCS2168343.1 MFS transporter [Scandinavium manionii]